MRSARATSAVVGGSLRRCRRAERRLQNVSFASTRRRLRRRRTSARPRKSPGRPEHHHGHDEDRRDHPTTCSMRVCGRARRRRTARPPAPQCGHRPAGLPGSASRRNRGGEGRLWTGIVDSREPSLPGSGHARWSPRVPSACRTLSRPRPSQRARRGGAGRRGGVPGAERDRACAAPSQRSRPACLAVGVDTSTSHTVLNANSE